MTGNKMLDAALAYAARGWRVFPVAAGKKTPRTANGFLDATTDATAIRIWWDGKPHLNVGVATGTVSGVWALDVDGEPGAASVMDLEQLHGELPETLTFRTPRGGRQHLFAIPPGVTITSSVGILPGIDVRGDGGYSVLPPSTRPEGPYAFTNEAPIADPPEWLVELVTNRRPSPTTASLDELTVESTTFRDHPGAGEGTRNREAARLAGCELTRGTPAATVLVDAIAWAARCRPPMALDELRDVLASIAGRESAKPEPVSGDDDGSGEYEPAVLEGIGVSDDGWRPIPVDAMPAVIAEWISATADAMGADPAMLATPMLPTLAGVIGNALAIELGGSWREPAILWAAVVAESGAAKTPAHEKVLEFVDAIDANLEQLNGEDRERFAAEARHYEAAFASWKSAARSKTGTDEPPPVEPAPAITRTVAISDTTPEALAVALRDNPKGLLLERDELSAWLAGFDRYRSTGGSVSAEAAQWLSLYNARPLRVDRRSSERIRIPRASVSIVGGIQPEILSRAVGAEHLANGLLPRFLLAAPPRRRRRFAEADVPEIVVARALTTITALHELPALPDGPRIVRLADGAKRVWRDFFEEHADRQHAATGIVASVLAKAEAAAGRIALVIHATRVASGERVDRLAVDADSMRRGIILSRWYADEWLRIHQGAISGSTIGEVEALVLRVVRQAGGDIADRELRRRSRRLNDAGGRGRAIVALVRAGRLETYLRHDGSGGRPALWIRTRATDATPVSRIHNLAIPAFPEVMDTGDGGSVENATRLPGRPSPASKHGRTL